VRRSFYAPFLAPLSLHAPIVYDTEVKTNATFMSSANRQLLHALRGQTQRIRLQKQKKTDFLAPVILVVIAAEPLALTNCPRTTELENNINVIVLHILNADVIMLFPLDFMRKKVGDTPGGCSCACAARGGHGRHGRHVVSIDTVRTHHTQRVLVKPGGASPLGQLWITRANRVEV
jgi:hypothetical protein